MVFLWYTYRVKYRKAVKKRLFAHKTVDRERPTRLKSAHRGADCLSLRSFFRGNKSSGRRVAAVIRQKVSVVKRKCGWYRGAFVLRPLSWGEAYFFAKRNFLKGLFI